MHGIEEIDGTPGSFAAVRQPAWHNLGVVVDEQVTAKKLLTLANADYEVFKTPSTTRFERPIAPGSPVTMFYEAEDPNRRQVCRFNPVTGQVEILGNVGEGYTPMSNEQVFVGFADALLDVAQPTVSTCGVLKGGRQAFMAFKLPRTLVIGGGDETDLWMFAHTSHDGSARATVAITPIRVVCQNTLRMALKNYVSSFSIRHSVNAKLNLDDAKKALGLTNAYADEFERIAEALIEHPMNTNQFVKLMTDLWGPGDEPSKRAVAIWDTKLDVLQHIWNGPTSEDCKFTAYAAYNTVAEYLDWETGVRSPSGTIKTASEKNAARFVRSVMGETAVTAPKDLMLRKIRELVGV